MNIYAGFTPFDVAAVGPLAPVRVLYEFDGPRIFSTRLGAFGEALAYLCADADGTRRFVVSPTTVATLDALVEGRLPVRDALVQPWVWVVDMGDDDAPRAAWNAPGDALPEAVLPRPGTMLAPELEPLLRIRMIGEGLGPGRVPASVVRRSVDGVQRALRSLVEIASDSMPSGGRPSEAQRRLYDLPTQHVAYGSFVMAFGAPRPAPGQIDWVRDEARRDEETFGLVTHLLAGGLRWVCGGGEDGEEPEALDRVLTAIAELGPPSTGAVSEVELGGRLVAPARGRSACILGRESQRRIRDRLRRPSGPRTQIVDVSGIVDEMDQGLARFTLRAAGDGRERFFTYDDELFEDVREAFHEHYRVRVVGEATTGARTIQLALIERESAHEPTVAG